MRADNFSDVRVVFLCGAFLSENRELVVKDSKGLIQNAADSLQKKYIKGFVSQENISSVDVVNMPFLFPYPKFYRRIFYKPVIKRGTSFGASFYEEGFLNLPVLRLFSRFQKAFFRSFILLRNLSKCPRGNVIFICYSMHLPFIAASVFLKFLFRKPVFGVIVPDLPEYMAERKGLRKIAGIFSAKIAYFLTFRFDFVVPITNQMGAVFEGKPFFVVEGMADCFSYENEADHLNGDLKLPEKYFLYSGTLDARYGIANLIDAFSCADTGEYYLVICGAGDFESEVVAAANKDPRIIFIGQVQRPVALRLQAKSSLLINPRNNLSEYTKYSFPSKIMEYMSSGVPVLMYKLDGIPGIYYKCCYLVDDYSGGLIHALTEISKLSNSDMKEKGIQAKEIVLHEKNPKAQVRSLLCFVSEKFYV